MENDRPENDRPDTDRPDTDRTATIGVIGGSGLYELFAPGTADEIDVARARDALGRAESELAGDGESETALAARDRARARLRAAGEEVPA